MDLVSTLNYSSRWLEDNNRKKRNRLEIAGDMLEAARNGARKTRIMYGANLSYELLVAYLLTLIKEGLLEDSDENGVYRTSKKGTTFLKEFAEFRKVRRLYEEKMTSLKKLLQVK